MYLGTLYSLSEANTQRLVAVDCKPDTDGQTTCSRNAPDTQTLVVQTFLALYTSLGLTSMFVKSPSSSYHVPF